MSEKLAKIRSYTMPISMLVGVALYRYIGELSFLTPYLIVVMLFITYCNISFKDIHFSRLHFWLILIQIFGSIAVYLLLRPINLIVAQGAMICILAPTATSAPVVTSMLGGNVASLTAYSILCNMVMIIVAPVLFSFVGEIDATSFLHSFWIVFQKVSILLFLPFFGAFLLEKVLPELHSKARKAKNVSFYIWLLALAIITGKTVQFIIDQDNPNYLVEVSIGVLALIICVGQFLIGRYLGNRCNDTIAGGQGLGQKNTILAIWMAQTYLNPLSSIGPGAYVLWQNLFNAYQLWKKSKNE